VAGPTRPRWVKLGLIGWAVVFVAVAAALGIDAVINSHDKGGAGDVRLVSCSYDGGIDRVTVVVANSGSKSATYWGFIDFNDANGLRVASASFDFENLRPGQSARQDLVAVRRTADVSCGLGAAERVPNLR